MAEGRCHHTLLAAGETMLAIGGVMTDHEGHGTAMRSVEMLDLKQDTCAWATAPSLNTARSQAACVWDAQDRRIWVIGGDGDRGASTSIEFLDLDKLGKGWTLLPDALPRNRIAAAAVALPSSRVAIITGGDRVTWLGLQAGERRSATVLDLDTGECNDKYLAPMNAERRGHCLVWLGCEG